MPVPFNEAMYPEVKQWLVKNPQDKSLSEPIKQSLLRFETLTKCEKEQLQEALLDIAALPDVIQQFMPDRLDALPGELANMVATNLDQKNFDNLTKSSKRTYFLFKGDAFDVAQKRKVFGKFLECVAYGQQDKAEKLLGHVFQGKPEKRQAVLLHQGTFTDYSGRTFHCSAYEYAYWAKDTHMCRMLERYMDEKTKSVMVARIYEMERIDAETGQPVGLVYQQNGAEHRSAHFDFTPLKEAYRRSLDGYAANNWNAINTAWLDVGKAQRNVPAHVAQEYCRPDRTFDPRREFNEATLPRVFTFYNETTDRDDSWFPLAASNSGLGFNFALIRARDALCPWRMCRAWATLEGAVCDLAAITRLDDVRTVELRQLREHLNPSVMSQSMNVWL